MDKAEVAAPVMDLTARFEVVYQLQEEFIPTQEQINAFSTGNAVYNYWPYFREYAQSEAMRASLPVLLIPFLRVQISVSPTPTENPET
ncbi:MAG TPA: hypothetical protein DEQ47_14415 [Solibacterales bacterium]|nr:hypothetical protein [Bryobacterales bacterium]